MTTYAIAPVWRGLVFQQNSAKVEILRVLSRLCAWIADVALRNNEKMRVADVRKWTKSSLEMLRYLKMRRSHCIEIITDKSSNNFKCNLHLLRTCMYNRSATAMVCEGLMPSPDDANRNNSTVFNAVGLARTFSFCTTERIFPILA